MKLILMSATINAEVFVGYFEQVCEYFPPSSSSPYIVIVDYFEQVCDYLK